MGSENNMVAVPEGMKRWHGGEHAPADWDGGDVLWQTPHGIETSGTTAEDRQWQVSPDCGWNIVAYTPARLASPQPDAQQGESVSRALGLLRDYIHAAGGDVDHEAILSEATATPSSPALDAATIERCAQVADDLYSNCTHSDTEAFAYQAAAKAIRQLAGAA